MALRHRFGEPIRVKGSPYYYVYRTDTITGDRRKLCTKCRHKRDARRWIDEHRFDTGVAEPVSFREAAARFMATKAKRVRPTTHRLYEGMFRHLNKTLGDRMLHEVSVQNLDALLDEPDWSPRTRNKYLTLIGGLYRWARARGYAQDNPVEFVQRERVEHREPRVLTAEEEERLLKACSEPYERRCIGKRNGRISSSEWTQHVLPHPMLRPAVLCALRTGLRRSNILDLTWSEVDLDRGRIQIPAKKAKGKRDIVIPVSPDLAEVLRALWRENRDRSHPALKVFEGLKSLDRCFRSVCRRAGLKDVTFHDLRRTYLTRLAPCCDPKTLQALGGHADITTTMKHYLGTSEERMQAAITRAFAKAEREGKTADSS